MHPTDRTANNDWASAESLGIDVDETVFRLLAGALMGAFYVWLWQLGGSTWGSFVGALLLGTAMLLPLAGPLAVALFALIKTLRLVIWSGGWLVKTIRTPRARP